MINIQDLRKSTIHAIILGNYKPIIQSILDFDYLSEKKNPSIVGIVAAGRKTARYFFGKKEILIPVFESVESIPQEKKNSINFVINLSSGRRVLAYTQEIVRAFPNLIGGSIFAEGVPEKHAVEISHSIKKKNIFLAGPASIGVVIPKCLKLGAIGGTDARQLIGSRLLQGGDVAVLSSSGGMTNELIRMVVEQKRRISFALSFGGERFPVVTPKEAFLAAEKDPETKVIVYFGELGGTDESEIAELLQTKQITKEVICYIAGVVADMFEEAPQFGHAKAMAKNENETAHAKKDMLKKAGAQVADTFAHFVQLVAESSSTIIHEDKDYSIIMNDMSNRNSALIATSISGDVDGEPTILGENLLTFSKKHSFAFEVVSLLLGRKIKSKNLEEFTDFILRLLVDHGPYVSGAVNTIIASRAGKDLMSSLAAGLLTIGPRFGGAINQAAANFLKGVTSGKQPFEFVEEFAIRREYIAGIGHKKYRIDLPDPRVTEILAFSEKLSKKRFVTFAREIEKITVAKKGNLILNVDGAIAAVLLDLLSEEEGISDTELKKLVDIEFFNALFVLSRSVGFVAHSLDQKRLDEGLFRLDEDLVAHAQ